MTAVADVLFRVFLHARLARRGETKKAAVTKLLSELLDNRGERCLNGIVLTLDRVFATEQMFLSLIDCRVACISVMKSISVRGYPFVGRSYLKVGRGDESNDDDVCNDTSGQVPIRPDRPTEFIIDEDPKFGNGSFRAGKQFGSGRQSQLVNAIALRCHGDAKHANIVRFLHAVSSPMHDCLHHWVTSHYTWDMEPYWFNYRTAKSRIRLRIEESDDDSMKRSIELYIKDRARVITTGQRCTDWFVMGEFRLTSTGATKFLLRFPRYRIATGLPPTEPLSDSPSQILGTLSKSWFSTSRK